MESRDEERAVAGLGLAFWIGRVVHMWTFLSSDEHSLFLAFSIRPKGPFGRPSPPLARRSLKPVERRERREAGGLCLKQTGCDMGACGMTSRGRAREKGRRCFRNETCGRDDGGFEEALVMEGVREEWRDGYETSCGSACECRRCSGSPTPLAVGRMAADMGKAGKLHASTTGLNRRSTCR